MPATGLGWGGCGWEEGQVPEPWRGKEEVELAAELFWWIPLCPITGGSVKLGWDRDTWGLGSRRVVALHCG